MANNQLCGLDFKGDGAYTVEGITKLCEGLKRSTVTSLKCAAPPPSAFVSAPIDTLSTRFRSHARSLYMNELGPQGGAALAEGLKGNSTLQSLEWPPGARTSSRVLICVSAH